jgi:hypothetical protein
MTHQPCARSPVAVFVAAVLASLVACGGGGGTSTAPGTTAVTTTPTAVTTTPTTAAPTTHPVPTAAPTTAAPSTAAPLPTPYGLPALTGAPFARYEPVQFAVDGVWTGAPAPTSLDDVYFAGPLLDAQAAWALNRRTLEQHGFLIDARWTTDNSFDEVYAFAPLSGGYDEVPLLVTTDAAFHTWHLVFAKVLRTTEQERFAPALQDLLGGLVTAARAQRDRLVSTPLADAASRVAQYAEAAATLAGVDVGPIGPLAQQEVDLADAHNTMTSSPITGVQPCNLPVSPAGCVDFTQFTPRGWYANDPVLTPYFLGMAFLGQESFAVNEPASLRMAALLTRLLTTDPKLAAAWKLVYEPTAFVVGAADDYTPTELAAALGPSLGDDAALADDATLAAAAERLTAQRPVTIDPEAATVRTMGVRSTLDSFILDQLGFPQVGTSDKPRNVVSALDVAAALGSAAAKAAQQASGQSNYLHYDEQLALLTQAVAARPVADWGRTVYDAWLYALAGVWAPKPAASPPLLRSPGWDAKSLQSGLGSYTELKHDTLLYVKEAFGGEGAAPPAPVPPRHWVEPDPAPFARLAAAAHLLADGLAARQLLTPEMTSLVADLTTMLDRLTAIATEELRTAQPSANTDDQAWLGRISVLLEQFRERTTDNPDDVGYGQSDPSTALVADLARNTEQVIEIATGGADTIVAILPYDRSTSELVWGAVYSTYEFARPASEGRLTDDEWRGMVQRGDVPPRPSWITAYFNPATGQVEGTCGGNGDCFLSIRSSPSTGSDELGRIGEGDHVSVSCQIRGRVVESALHGTSDVWVALTDGGYVSGLFLDVPGWSRYDVTNPC